MSEPKQPAFPRLARRIHESARADPPLLVVAFGDSVTQGYMADQELLPERAYHSQVISALREMHPLRVFNLLNAGIGGQKLGDGLQRLDRDVISHRPDLVIVGFGLNDSALGEAGLRIFNENLSHCVSRIQRETEAEIILLTPNMMCHANNAKIAPRWRDAFPNFRRRQQSGLLAKYAAEIRQFGEEHAVPVADVYSAWEEMRRSGFDTDKLLANGLNHPDPEGHKIASDLILDLLIPLPPPG